MAMWPKVDEQEAAVVQPAERKNTSAEVVDVTDSPVEIC